LVLKTKTNGWLDSSGIRPAWLACLPLPEGAKYMAIINIADPPEYPEEVTLYAHLWASFARRITVTKTFICIFNVLGCQIVHNYFLNMAQGYIVYRCVVATTTHHFNQDALNGLLITLAVFRHQVPNFLWIWEEILSWPSDVAENNWMQARSFAHHPSCRPPLFSLMFVPPDMPTGPWEICTQWSEQELTALMRGAAKSPALCQHVHLHVAGLKPALWYQHPQVHPWADVHHLLCHCGPMPGALALPPAAPNPSEPDAPADNEGDMSTLMACALQHKLSKTP
jgi:hypothetical protein